MSTSDLERRKTIQEMICFRAGTADDRWVIPEIIKVDMYRFAQLAELLRGHRGYVLDCGAHIGAFSLMAAQFLPWLDIRCYEPQPDSSRYLITNTASFPKVTCFRQAVAGSSGEIRLYDANGETGNWTCLERKGRPFELVSGVRLADLIDGSCQLLKLDLEGFEAELLNQLPIAKLKLPTVLVLEEHGFPVDYSRLRDAGLEILFRPYDSPRHSVWHRIMSSAAS